MTPVLRISKEPRFVNASWAAAKPEVKEECYLASQKYLEDNKIKILNSTTKQICNFRFGMICIFNTYLENKIWLEGSLV